MARTITVGATTYDRDQFSTAVDYCFAAYETVGPQPWADLTPQVRLAAFVKPLKEPAADASEPTQLLLDLGMAFDASTLAGFPDVECVHGRVPIDPVELDRALTALDGVRKDKGADGERALHMLAAVAQLLDHLPVIRETYWARCTRIWSALRTCEWVASDFYVAFLVHNRAVAIAERARYLYPKSAGAHVPRAASDDFVGMTKGLAMLAATRRVVDLDAIKREQTVVTGISLALSACAIASAVQQGRLVMSTEDERKLHQAVGLATEAAQHSAEAMLRYLDAVRRHAETYPILTLLGPREVRADALSYLAVQIDAVVDDAIEAIDELVRDACAYLIPKTHVDVRAISPATLAKLIANAPTAGVWRVPFFVDRAIQTLATEDASDVHQVIALAATLESSGAIRGALALGAIEAAMIAAPAAGPIGVGIALAWGVLGVIQSVREYRELAKLFDASIDPQFLLRGLEHEPASKLGMILSLLGLVVV